ncbi:MAG TPA: YciI family protein [Burkholderiales bacterium]|nr:YciI family protein [Burkholderiales bacterium]
MRFLSMIRIDEKTGKQPSERLMNEMGKLMEEMIRAGALISTAGLRPTAEGVRVRSRYGRLSKTEGPFTESKEVIGGYAVLEAPSMKEALELTERFLHVHGDEWDLECEVRPLDGPEFGARA